MKTAITAIFWYSLLLAFLLICGWAYAEYIYRRTLRENEYETLYKEIQSLLFCPGDDKKLQELIRLKIREIKTLKWRNREKTQVLDTEYLRKFYSDEFGPESIF